MKEILEATLSEDKATNIPDSLKADDHISRLGLLVNIFWARKDALTGAVIAWSIDW